MLRSSPPSLSTTAPSTLSHAPPRFALQHNDPFGSPVETSKYDRLVHLGLLGYLIYRSRYIPRIIGVLLVIDGLGWLLNSVRPYLFPNAHLLARLFFIFSFTELLL